MENVPQLSLLWLVDQSQSRTLTTKILRHQSNANNNISYHVTVYK